MSHWKTIHESTEEGRSLEIQEYHDGSCYKVLTTQKETETSDEMPLVISAGDPIEFEVEDKSKLAAELSSVGFSSETSLRVTASI